MAARSQAKALASGLAMVAVLLGGCAHREVNPSQMTAEMNGIRATGKSGAINILWYEGSDERFDYFGYVYSMTGSRGYKVPVGEFVLKDRFPFTEDSDKWVRIREIEGMWVADRLSDGVWRPDREGIGIQVKPAGN